MPITSNHTLADKKLLFLKEVVINAIFLVSQGYATELQRNPN